jgi:hypothetical protein
MQPGFRPPATEAEFRERADKVPDRVALTISKTLQSRREALLKEIDAEILFYARILKERKLG